MLSKDFILYRYIIVTEQWISHIALSRIYFWLTKIRVLCIINRDIYKILHSRTILVKWNNQNEGIERIKRINVARFSDRSTSLIRLFYFSLFVYLFLSLCLSFCLPIPRRCTRDFSRWTLGRPRTTSNDYAAVSLPDPAINVMNAAAASVPIATSTPVNLAAGPLSPPPLTLAAGQGPHHEHPPGTAPTVKVTSYPAVLKGRSAASPPNPNLVPSGKVPPPVPPRGTGASRTGRSSEDHRAAGTAASTTSSVTSSRGDEAAIITRYRLHDSSCDLHHSLL